MGLLDSFLTQGTTPPNPDATFPQLLSSPMGQGLLGTIASFAANARRGAPVNSIGAGLLGGLSAYSNAGQEDMKRRYMQAQMDNLQSEIATRTAAQKKQDEMLGIGRRIASSAQQPVYQQGQLGSGSFDVVPTAAGVNPIPQNVPTRGIGGADLGDLAQFHMLGGADLLPYYKAANEGFKRDAGAFYDIPGRGTVYIPKVPEGAMYANGRITGIPGFSDFTTQQTFATEAPKTLLNAAGKVNLRPNADGTQSPVSELSENPTLQNVLGAIYGGGAMPPSAPPVVGGRAAMPPAAVPRPMGPAAAPVPAPQPGVKGAFVGDPAQVSASIEAIRDPQERANARAAFEAQMRANGRLGQYGKTTAQETAEAVDKAKRLKQVEADVRPTEQRQNEIAGSNYMLSVIDQAIEHPGRETATGLSGTLDPRNYLPGTNAKGFQSLMDQIRGGTFMQAYQNLKGGGQITEVEGKKAENAIARLNTAQSDEEVLKALRELRQVVSNGLIRQKAGMRASNGATGSFDGDNSDMGQTQNLPTPMKGMVRNGYRFKGGDPANPASWEKQ